MYSGGLSRTKILQECAQAREKALECSMAAEDIDKTDPSAKLLRIDLCQNTVAEYVSCLRKQVQTLGVACQ